MVGGLSVEPALIRKRDSRCWPESNRNYTESMIGENRQLLQMNRLGLRNKRLKFKIAGKLPISLEESIEYTQI